mgnify:FL=1
MFKMLFAVLLLSAFTGCAGVATQGAAVSDDIRDTAEFALCKGITVGSWVRAYGNSPERAKAWRTLCSQTVSETPAR